MNAQAIGLWIVKLIAVAALGYAAFLKLTSAQVEIDLFTKLDMEPAGRYAVGACEALAALLILIPQSQVYGAILGLGVMIGATIGHLTAIGLGGIQYAIAVAVCCLVVLYVRRRDAAFLSRLFDR